MQQIHDRAISIQNNIQKSFSNSEDILEKGDIHYAIQDSFREGTFKKKGKDLKDLASKKKEDYLVKYNKALKQLGSLKEVLKDSDCCMFSEHAEYETPQIRYAKEYNQIPQETREKMEMYSNLSYQLREMKNDLRALNVLVENLDDSKEYPVSLKLITALQL